MSFWSSETLTLRAPREGLITPFQAERIKNAAYELALGDEAYVSSTDGKKSTIPRGSQLVIPAGQFALLLTDETVKVPADAIGLISIKAGVKFKGLVNVSGFHVDPGFHAKLTFSVYNAGSQNIVLDQGKPLFLLWFCSLDTKTKDVYLKSGGKDHLSAQDVMNVQGDLASPAALKKEIDALSHEVENINNSFENAKILVRTVGISLFVATVCAVGAYMSGCITPPWNRNQLNTTADSETEQLNSQATIRGNGARPQRVSEVRKSSSTAK